MICNINKFRARLAAGDVLLGPSLSFADPSAVEALCESADFLWLDLEHSPIDLETVQTHLIAASAGGAPILVRVPSGDEAWTKRVLDIGAEGIIFPQARSLAEVEAFVAACRYPPLGRRGFGPRRATNYGREKLGDYLERSNREVFVAVQIETAEALAAVEEIAQVPGIDSLVVGPADLAGALVGQSGHVWHPTILEKIAQVCAVAKRAGLSVGIGMGPDAAFAAHVAGLGVQWMQCGGDCGFMLKGMEDHYKAVRTKLKEGGGK